jgi:hypothetical protein
MKTIALTILLFTFSVLSHAQLKKGQWMIVGTADFSYSHSETHLTGSDQESKSTAYRFSPGIGYFFIDRLCGGLRVEIANNKTIQDYSSTSNPFMSKSHGETKASGWGISPFLRYYFLPVGRKVNVFADGAYSCNDETSKSSSWFRQDNPPPGSPSYGESFSKTSYTSNSFSVSAGPVIFINPKVSLELSVGYKHRTAKKQDLTSNSILLGTGFQVYFGK